MAKRHFSQVTVALAAVVVSSVVAAVGLMTAQSSTETWSCDMNAGGEKGQGPTTCGGQGRPLWDACIKFVCSMTSSGTEGGGGGCTTAMPTNPSAGQWYECMNNVWELKGTPTTGGSGGSCSGMTGAPAGQWYEWDSAGNSCVLRGTSTSGGGVCPEFTMYRPCIESCMSRGGAMTCPMCGSECSSGGGSTYPATCTACITAGGTQLSCPTCPGYTGGGTVTTGGDCYSRCIAEPSSPTICTTRCYPGTGTSSDCDRCMSEGGTRISCENSGRCPRSGVGGATSYAECVAQECASMSAPTAYQACKDSCQSRFGGVGGGGGTEWCFYSATKDGSDLGYSIACPKGSTSDCHKYTRQGEQVPSAGLTLKSSSSCWFEGGGGNWPTTGGTSCSACQNMPMGTARDQCYSTPSCGSGGGGDGSSSMRRCIYHNAAWQMGNQLKKTPGSIGKDVYCKADREGCDVLTTAAGTQKSLPVDTPQGYGIPVPRMDVSLGAPFCCEEGWSKKCEGSSMNCRDSDAYYKCLGGQSTPSNSELARACEQKHCWSRDGDTGQKWTCCPKCNDPTGMLCPMAPCVVVGSGENPPSGYVCGEGGADGGEVCRRQCTYKLANCRRRAALAYSPMWCDETLEECMARCPGGGKPEPEGCKGTPPTSEVPGSWKCVGKQWVFVPVEPPPPPVDFCKKFPEHEKCRQEPKPKPGGTVEEKLAALEEKISALDAQIEDLRANLQGVKDDISAKNDEIRSLKKSKAPRSEISAAQKELKALKRSASAIVSKGKKLARELKFREKEHDRLSQFQSRYSPPPYAY